MRADDLVREELAASECELAARVAAYREVTQAAVHELHEREVHARSARARVEHLVTEVRQLRSCHNRQLTVARDYYRRLQGEVRRLRACVMADARTTA